MTLTGRENLTRAEKPRAKKKQDDSGYGYGSPSASSIIAKDESKTIVLFL
ncbi:hypothetical protein CCACVL1_14521 [Corchorus capsularis]|uniref:Uncharacterized protein n=1 Tax=Corchorus capsularis TaxID=210143 RepID=A0A1R3I6T1_COCAP|nr:hypothetical protein CCACVL1_14521 [Corchorus capsularis]